MVGPATYQRFRAVESELQFEMRPEMREQKQAWAGHEDGLWVPD